ncbi:MAG: hypothetical protein ABSG99_02465 [Sedimentisphaerales bacterium]
MKKVYLIAIMAAALLAAGQAAQGTVLNSCAQWANYCSGNYCVYNDVWHPSGSWSQCIVAESCTNWYVDACHPGNGVKSYPNSSRINVNMSIGSLGSCLGNVSTSGPSSGDYCTAWDIWAPSEVMIWLNWRGAVSPWGSYVTSATIGGRDYDVYKDGYPGFLLKKKQVSDGIFDIKSILDYCVSRGWLNNSGNISKIQCGFEITGTGGSTLRYTMNSFSVFVSNNEWLYGDFTYDNKVDVNDLHEFCETWWLAGDCNDTIGVDLNGDCTINFYEYAFFAQNWLGEL